MTSCGETSERVAAGIHGLVAMLYFVMLFWHIYSTCKHLERDYADY